MENLELKDQIQRPREITFKTYAMTDEEIIKILKFIHKCPISIKK